MYSVTVFGIAPMYIRSMGVVLSSSSSRSGRGVMSPIVQHPGHLWYGLCGSFFASCLHCSMLCEWMLWGLPVCFSAVSIALFMSVLKFMAAPASRVSSTSVISF